VGAGGAAGTGDAANLLKPALARGQLRTIGATTWAEYKKYIEKDPALTRRFQNIQVTDHAPLIELLAVHDDLNPVVVVMELPLWPRHPRHDVEGTDVSAQPDFTGHRQHSCHS